MVEIINTQRIELESLCRKHRVRRLEVFGSAADGTFDPTRSDIDFLVDFFPFKPGTAFDTYFDMLEGLESLFERKIDLVDVTCLRNPYFIRGVNESRTTVYEAPTEQISG